MKQFTIFKILTFSALVIAIFPAFAMDKQRKPSGKSLELLLNMGKLTKKKKSERDLLINKGEPNQYMKYYKIKGLSKSKISGNHTVEITAYLLGSFCVWACPNPCGNNYRIEQARCNSIQMEKLYITLEAFKNDANWEL